MNPHPPSFEEPADWYQEDEDDIAATVEFYRVIQSLVKSGHGVDCLCVWNNPSSDEVVSLEVNLGKVSETSFRFFDNYHFVFR